jgi:hypothetical protein
MGIVIIELLTGELLHASRTLCCAFGLLGVLPKHFTHEFSRFCLTNL